MRNIERGYISRRISQFVSISAPLLSEVCFVMFALAVKEGRNVMKNILVIGQRFSTHSSSGQHW
jgi:hypothetical protein